MKKDIRLKILLLGLLACLSVGVTSAASPEWLEKMKQIRLLESKRQDVVALFGPAKPAGNALIDTWGLVHGSLSAIYASGECVAKTENGKTKLLGWRVPKDTVIEISFSLNKPVSPKKLGIDLSRLRGEQVRTKLAHSTLMMKPPVHSTTQSMARSRKLAFIRGLSWTTLTANRSPKDNADEISGAF
ncbi:MAG: hypothetical protein IPJ30_23070 [Acidobacteria bacterium]|nr:hypothetical protein [Acidobacteriota bacterium]